MNKFINRKEELSFLESQKNGCFVVLYGRRRVGKSELIKRFIAGKRAVYLPATQEVEKEVIGDFSGEVAKYFKDEALRLNPFFEFKQLLDYLKTQDIRGLIVAIDEFPYLIDSNKAIPSILQKYWDGGLKEKGLNLILCGSSVGAMETEVLGRKSPLYGRRTAQWKLDPLSFEHFMEFFPGISLERLVEFYSITGGIPAYVQLFDGQKNAFENAKLAAATRGAFLYDEAQILLKEELREPRVYFSLLRAISKGKTKVNEIANEIGMERTSLTRYLDILIELGLIDGRKPFGSKETSKNTRYFLKDNYFNFWFQFIYPFQKELDSFDFDDFENHFEKNFNSYVGRQFEFICREAARKINGSVAGSWWGFTREDGERRVAEIDIVSFRKERNELLLGECKWQDKVNANVVLADLLKKSNYFPTYKNIKFVIFAKSFSQRTEKDNVIILDLPALKKIFLGK